MKKFLALLFVCAGMTAMAAAPHSIKTVNLAKQTVLSKTNTLGNELTKPAMNKVLISDAKGSIQEFALTHDLKQNNLRQRAPRRLAQEDLATTWIASNIEFVDVDGTWTPKYYAGGSTTWAVDTFVERLNVTVFDINDAFILADPDGDGEQYEWGYYFPVYFDTYWDYNLGFIEGGPQAIYHVGQEQISQSTMYTTVRDTYWYPIIVDEAFYTGASDTIADMVMLTEIDDSGILYSSEKYGVIHAYVRYDTRYSNWTGQATSETLVDSVAVKAGLFGSNYFLQPNADHEYTIAQETENPTPGGDYYYQLGSTLTDGVLAYQNEANDSIFIWNMWGLAYRDAFMTIDSEGLMNFPLQYVHEENVDEWNERYAERGWVFSEGYLNLPVEYDFDNDTIISIRFAETPVELNDAHNKIVWGGNQVLDWFERTMEPEYEGYMFMGIGYIPFLRNSITLKGDAVFNLPEPDETWKLGDVNHDTFIDVADVSALISFILGNMPEIFYIEQANVDQDADSAYDVGDVTALISLILNN